MQCLQQVEVPVGIYITACYGGWPGQVWPEPEEESVTFSEDCYNFGADA